MQHEVRYTFLSKGYKPVYLFQDKTKYCKVSKYGCIGTAFYKPYNMLFLSINNAVTNVLALPYIVIDSVLSRGVCAR